MLADDEPVCTLFFAGFPPDMQVREFVNMFTFLPGFVAAVLKRKQADDEITTVSATVNTQDDTDKKEVSNTNGKGHQNGLVRWEALVDHVH
jgi:hypothetical protein